jgi:hypothetical protein
VPAVLVPAPEHDAVLIPEVPSPPSGETAGLTGPTALGYVSLNGLSVMRVQRGKPTNSFSVRCYREFPKCTFIVPLWCGPNNDELFESCLAVPAGVAGESAGNKELAAKHIALATKWKASAQPSASS